MVSVNFLLDKTLGQYKVIEHVGHGGMAEVYKGQHLRLDRMVAVKVLHPFLAEEEGFVVRFEREARIVATLRHPNIVQVYDFDHDDELGIYYMVMEFIDGPNLKARLSGGPILAEETARIGISIADALDYAHQRGMLHRDIKPANIMFTAEGQPVLADFGIAKMVDVSALTATGAMVGTPAYMAPEIGLGKRANSAADIYSLGIVLYNMVTGRLPFDSDSPMGMVMQHINDSPPLPTEFMPGVPSALESVILKAMEKQPEERYRRGKDMADALRYVVGATIPPSPVIDISPTPAEAAASPSEDMETPAVGIKTAEEAGEEKDVLVRSTSPGLETPTGEKLQMSAQIETPTKKPSFLWRILRSLILLLLVAILTGAGWLLYTGGNEIPAFITQWNLPLPDLGIPTATARPDETEPATETSEPTATVAPETEAPTLEATQTVELPVATLTPVPTLTSTPTPEPCTLDAKLEGVRVQPDNNVPPETPLNINIIFRNTGNCAWPPGITLALDASEAVSVSEAVTLTTGLTATIKGIAPGARGNVVLGMTAPPALGTYRFTWALYLPDGQRLGTPLPHELQVEDLPPLTLTPEVEEDEEEEAIIAPLSLSGPKLLEMTEDVNLGQWSATVQFTATGGIGNYRYYQGYIADTTETSRTLTLQGRHCESVPLTFWAQSGPDVTSWEGAIDYPWPENCESAE